MEELKLIHSLIRPKYFVPVHGEYRHLYRHAQLAENLGMNRDDIFIMGNGDCLLIDKHKAEHIKDVVPAEAVLVDGLGVGDVGNIVLKDRRMLSEAGLILVAASLDRATGEVVSGPEIVSRGFVYVRENEDLICEAREVVAAILAKPSGGNRKDWNSRKTAVRDGLKTFIYEKTKRNPIILTIFLEV